MLEYSPDERITLREAMKHTFFDPMRREYDKRYPLDRGARTLSKDNSEDQSKKMEELKVPSGSPEGSESGEERRSRSAAANRKSAEVHALVKESEAEFVHDTPPVQVAEGQQAEGATMDTQASGQQSPTMNKDRKRKATDQDNKPSKPNESAQSRPWRKRLEEKQHQDEQEKTRRKTWRQRLEEDDDLKPPERSATDKSHSGGGSEPKHTETEDAKAADIPKSKQGDSDSRDGPDASNSSKQEKADKKLTTPPPSDKLAAMKAWRTMYGSEDDPTQKEAPKSLAITPQDSLEDSTSTGSRRDSLADGEVPANETLEERLARRRRERGLAERRKSGQGGQVPPQHQVSEEQPSPLIMRKEKKAATPPSVREDKPLSAYQLLKMQLSKPAAKERPSSETHHAPVEQEPLHADLEQLEVEGPERSRSEPEPTLSELRERRTSGKETDPLKLLLSQAIQFNPQGFLHPIPHHQPISPIIELPSPAETPDVKKNNPFTFSNDTSNKREENVSSDTPQAIGTSNASKAVNNATNVVEQPSNQAYNLIQSSSNVQKSDQNTVNSRDGNEVVGELHITEEDLTPTQAFVEANDTQECDSKIKSSNCDKSIGSCDRVLSTSSTEDNWQSANSRQGSLDQSCSVEDENAPVCANVTVKVTSPETVVVQQPTSILETLPTTAEDEPVAQPAPKVVKQPTAAIAVVENVVVRQMSNDPTIPVTVQLKPEGKKKKAPPTTNNAVTFPTQSITLQPSPVQSPPSVPPPTPCPGAQVSQVVQTGPVVKTPAAQAAAVAQASQATPETPKGRTRAPRKRPKKKGSGSKPAEGCFLAEGGRAPGPDATKQMDNSNLKVAKPRTEASPVPCGIAISKTYGTPQDSALSMEQLKEKGRPHIGIVCKVNRTSCDSRVNRDPSFQIEDTSTNTNVVANLDNLDDVYAMAAAEAMKP